VTIEGPRFSTQAESQIFRQLGCSLIGMTSSPEAYLAREAEISYASMVYITDYDAWRQDVDPVTVCGLAPTMVNTSEIAQQALANAVEALDITQEFPSHRALEGALLTNLADLSPDTRARFEWLLARAMSAS
jgi:5'-methylthioadenosine phosphorylase